VGRPVRLGGGRVRWRWFRGRLGSGASGCMVSVRQKRSVF